MSRYHHHHQSLNRKGHWGTTDDFATSFLHFFPVLHCLLGIAELQARPFPHCALQDDFGQTQGTGNMTIPLQFVSLYNSQEVFVWPICLLDLGTDFLVGNMVFV